MVIGNRAGDKTNRESCQYIGGMVPVIDQTGAAHKEGPSQRTNCVKQGKEPGTFGESIVVGIAKSTT